MIRSCLRLQFVVFSCSYYNADARDVTDMADDTEDDDDVDVGG